MAGWVWGVYGEPITIAYGNTIYSKSKRASSEEDISRRVFGIVEKTWNSI
jgi:hypothetical protein